MHLGKKMLAGAAISLFLLPLAARADASWSPAPPLAIQRGEPAPGGHHGKDGRYELRAVTQWVEGRYQQVWVPERCIAVEGHRGWWRRARARCTPAHWEQRWTPGHSEQVTRWVWVPFDKPGHGWGRRARGSR